MASAFQKKKYKELLPNQLYIIKFNKTNCLEFVFQIFVN